MNAETLWLLWTSRGWDVPVQAAVLLMGWLADEECDEVMIIDGHGEVNGRARNGTMLLDRTTGWINDYAPLLVACWLLNHGVGASPNWYDRFPYVRQAVTDPAVMAWARRIKA